MLFLDVVHESRDLDETRAYLRHKSVSLDRVDRQRFGAFNARLTASYHDDFYVGEITYGIAAELRVPAEAGGYVLSYPTRGRLLAETPAGDVACDGRRALVLSPSHPQHCVASFDASRVAVSIRPDALRTHFARLTGEPVTGAIVFDPALDLHDRVGRAILAAIDLFAGSGAGQSQRTEAPARVAAFQDSVLSTLLLYHRHSHSDLLEGDAPSPASSDVKRAVDYIQANLGEPIRLATLIAVANVPGRTLNEHFRAFTGLSPLAYVKRERLKAARRLLTGAAAATVTEAAVQCGFSHLGRFALDYAQAYGEPPSRTIRGGRRTGH